MKHFLVYIIIYYYTYNHNIIICVCYHRFANFLHYKCNSNPTGAANAMLGDPGLQIQIKWIRYVSIFLHACVAWVSMMNLTTVIVGHGNHNLYAC